MLLTALTKIIASAAWDLLGLYFVLSHAIKYLTGFHQRKEKRREVAKQQLEQQIRMTKLKMRKKKREHLNKLFESKKGVKSFHFKEIDIVSALENTLPTEKIQCGSAIIEITDLNLQKYNENDLNKESQKAKIRENKQEQEINPLTELRLSSSVGTLPKPKASKRNISLLNKKMVQFNKIRKKMNAIK